MEQQFLIITIFTIITLLFVFDKNQRVILNKKGSVLIYLCLLLLLIFRPSDMADYENYTEAFKRTYNLRFEPVFLIIKYLAALSSNPGFWGIAFYALLSSSIRYNYILKFSTSVYASVLIYISNVYIAQDMIAIRVALATALLLPALYYKTIGNYKYMLIVLLLCILSHYTSALFLIIIMISPKKSYSYLYLLLLLGAFILAYRGYTVGGYLSLIRLSQVQVLVDLYSNQEGINIFNLLQYGRVLICCFCWFIQIKHSDTICANGNSLSPVLLLKLYTIGLVLAFIFSDIISISVRSSEILLSVEVLMIPLYFKTYFRNEILFKSIILLYSSIILYISLHDTAYWPNL